MRIQEVHKCNAIAFSANNKFLLVSFMLLSSCALYTPIQKRHISDWKINHRVAHVLNPLENRQDIIPHSAADFLNSYVD